MHTHNVKTAAPESSERWEAKRLESVVAEQKNFLEKLSIVGDRQLTEEVGEWNQNVITPVG